jgi:hypothetical protein
MENFFDKFECNEKYGFYIFSSPIYYPFSFLRHCHIVIIEDKKVSRIEVWNFKNKKDVDLGYIHIDLIPALRGVRKFNFKRYPKFNCSLVGFISGGYGSLAEDMVKFVNDRINEYPSKFNYNYFFKPNCNTFVSWVLSNFKTCEIKLPKNAIGKSD